MLLNLLRMSEFRRIPIRILFALILVIMAIDGFGGVLHATEEHASQHQLKNPDGSWKWTNALIHETSPYLLLHVHNPVEWYPWGAEALERAKAENKPIFLSVGYSTCYWCHVMERKVFSNPEIAELMNRWFINIKVDREERPDIDEIYMTATQIMTQHGGWPNSVFLTPDLLPFFAGTYFPPEDSVGRPGFPRILRGVHDAWMNQRELVIDRAKQITAVIRQATSEGIVDSGETPLDRQLIEFGVKYLTEMYSSDYGGFGDAPKFPSPTNLEFLLGEYQRRTETRIRIDSQFARDLDDGRFPTDLRHALEHAGFSLSQDVLVSVKEHGAEWVITDVANKQAYPVNADLGELTIYRPAEALLKMISHTLDMMAYGGMYDQIGGGFHRYSVDAKWLVPHFEKMLYDNAQLARVYLHTYHLTKERLYRTIAEEIFEFVFREMTSPEGGFYSAIDAEVDAEEGKFYVWTKAEIRKILGKRKAKLFNKVYGVEKGPNFEGETNILYLPAPIASVSKAEGKSEGKILRQLEPLKSKLLAAREKRKRPLLDTKVITSWNGLMIDALAYGYEVLGDTRYRDAAQRAAEFIMEHLTGPDGQLMRTYKDDIAKYDGYLDDYTFVVRGLLGLYRATGEGRWLKEAKSLNDTMIRLFWDNEGGGFYFTLADQEYLVVRTKNPYDSALPSGNAVAINNLLTLAHLSAEKDYLDNAEKSLRSFASVMAQSPGGFMHMLLGANNYLSTDWTEARGAQEKQHSKFATKLKGEGGINANSPLKSLSGIDLPAGNDVVKVSVPELSKKQISHQRPFDIEVQLEIGDGWHINANPASDDFLIPTTLSVSPDAAVEVISASYPKGKPLKFSYNDDPLSVYEGVLTIHMQLQMKPGVSREEAFPVNLNLEYQACDDQRCLPPSTDSIQLKLDHR